MLFSISKTNESVIDIYQHILTIVDNIYAYSNFMQDNSQVGLTYMIDIFLLTSIYCTNYQTTYGKVGDQKMYGILSLIEDIKTLVRLPSTDYVIRLYSSLDKIIDNKSIIVQYMYELYDRIKISYINKIKEIAYLVDKFDTGLLEVKKPISNYDSTLASDIGLYSDFYIDSDCNFLYQMPCEEHCRTTSYI